MPTDKRIDFDTIEGLVPAGARVLDLGCGDGTLLEQLVQGKNVEARGVEISEDNVRACISRGLSVRHGNIEEGLADYRDTAFDYVILSKTLAYLNHPEPVAREMLRVGRHAIISFDNAGHWRTRARALIGHGMGTTLVSGDPRVRAITLAQFKTFSNDLNARVEQSIYLSGSRATTCLPALCATTAVFVLTKNSA